MDSRSWHFGSHVQWCEPCIAGPRSYTTELGQARKYRLHVAHRGVGGWALVLMHRCPVWILALQHEHKQLPECIPQPCSCTCPVLTSCSSGPACKAGAPSCPRYPCYLAAATMDPAVLRCKCLAVPVLVLSP